MLPGSPLPPSLQIAAASRRESACANEEEYAQKHGRVVQLPRTKRARKLVFLGSLVLIAVPILLILLRTV